MSEQQVKTRPAGPVTGERAPVLHVLAPSTPMARMIRERLDAQDASAVSGESGDEPIPEA